MSTPADRPQLPARLVADVVIRDGETWWTCPVDGPDCCRVSARMGDWAADAIAWHVSNHHRIWR